ncbi:hypothetical protein Cpir12675_006787, partial [Ceratocystis pirilliformis]
MSTLTTPAAKTAPEAPAPKRATTNIDSGKKALTFADIARKPAQTPTAATGAAAKKPHEATKQGGKWQTVSHRKAEKPAQGTGRSFQPAAREDNRVLIRLSVDNELHNCESFLLTTRLKEIDQGLGKALKNVLWTKPGFALVANNKEMIQHCFAQAAKVAPVYTATKTQGNEKTFTVKIPVVGAGVPKQLRMGSRLIPHTATWRTSAYTRAQYAVAHTLRTPQNAPFAERDSARRRNAPSGEKRKYCPKTNGSTPEYTPPQREARSPAFQEPYIGDAPEELRTVRHPKYKIMASMGTEGERPRVLTYVQNEIVATL